METLDNAMRRQVFSLPQLIEEQYELLEPITRKILTTPEIFSIQRVVLTGCGDSHAAAMAVKPTFEKLTGLPVEVVSAIDLARHYDAKGLGFAPLNPLVIAVSNSGTVARVSEAIQRAVSHGAFALGITGNAQSPLGQASSRVLPLSVPKFESAPGIRSYMVATLALFLLAIRIGEVRGRYTMDEAMDYRYDLQKQGGRLQASLAEMDGKMVALAQEWQTMEAYDFIGSGADYAAAWYGHAKVFEAVGRYAMTVNTEEWLHLNFFMRRFQKIGTVLVCSSHSPAISRAKEMLGYAVNDLKRPTLLVSNENVFDVPNVNWVQVPQGDYEPSMLLTQFVPLALLTGYMGHIIGEVDGRGCQDNWSFAQNGAAVQQSQLIIL